MIGPVCKQISVELYAPTHVQVMLPYIHIYLDCFETQQT